MTALLRTMGLALLLFALIGAPSLALAQETEPETPTEETEEYVEKAEEAAEAAEEAAEAAEEAAEAAMDVAEGNMAQEATILDQLQQRGEFTTLIAAVEQAGLADALRSESNLTLFAPNDAAFAKLPEGAVAGMDAAELAALLQYHLLVDKVMAEQAVEAGELMSAQGSAVAVMQTDDGSVMVGDANVVEGDIEASNGIIHVIDAVMMVPAPAEQMEQPADDMDGEEDSDGDQ